MKVELKHPDKDDTCLVPRGFSWSYLFLGPLVCLLRGDVKWMLISFVASIFTGGLSQVILAFMYNNLFLNERLEAGYYPADEETLDLLKREGIAEEYLRTA
jgi:hypothetical protein